MSQSNSACGLQPLQLGFQFPSASSGIAFKHRLVCRPNIASQQWRPAVTGDGRQVTGEGEVCIAHRQVLLQSIGKRTDLNNYTHAINNK